MAGAEGGGVFSDCSVAFVPSNNLTGRMVGELSIILRENGATICEPKRDGSIPIEKVTHIISNTINFEQFTESQAIMIPVVTTSWIENSIHRRKQVNVRPYSPDPRMIFSQVVVTCGDLPVMDKESIIGATMALGGQESKDATRLTTHICSLSMDHDKVRMSLKKGWTGKVVLPHWFDDCFKLGKRIDEGPYLLPNPKILDQAPNAQLEFPETPSLVGASSANPSNHPNNEVARPPSTVFQDRQVMFSSDLNITTRLQTGVEEIIERGGGRVVQDVSDCDMFICQYRDGPGYVRAAQSCKDVGNLAWLYYLITHNEWSSPLHHLMHYPMPKDGIEGFKGLRITVSNYGGEARIYLENLIKACGAEFTKTMKQENTHLITARNTSEKCQAAPEWGIAVVNHLWIEECYAKSEMKPYNIPRYNHFPLRTNLGEIIGRAFFDESRLREMYYPGGEEHMSPRAKRKRKIIEAAEENAYSHGPAEGVVIGRAGQSRGFGVKSDSDGGKDSATKRKESNISNVATPIRPRRVASGKENDTPSVVSTEGRSAKAKARDLLHNIAPDIALYEKEKKRHSKAGPSPWGGKRAADLADKDKEATRSASPQDEAEEPKKRPAKKARPSLPEIEWRIVITGFSRWIGDSHKEDQERRKLRDLGIQIVQAGQPCDYLAAPNIVRTVKFLCALARGPTVISTDFIEDMLNTGKVPTPEEYILEDNDNEEKFNISLETSMARAKSNRGKLLRGMPIYCTEKIRNGPDSYKSIAEANGAMFMVYRARSGTTIKPTTAEEDGHRPPEPVYLLSSVSPEERQMWARFIDMAQKGNMEPRIVAPDWLLDVAMAQEVRYDEKFLAEDFFQEVE